MATETGGGGREGGETAQGAPQSISLLITLHFSAWELAIIKTLKASSKSFQAVSKAPSGRSLLRLGNVL